MTSRPDSDTLYREQHGNPRNLPDDHPDRWQWEYTGRSDEKADLLERLRAAAGDALEPPAADGTHPDQLELL